MALEIIDNIAVDMNHPNAETVNVVQYDTADVVKIQLLNNGQKWSVPNNVSAAVLFKKSDRIGGYYDKLTINDQAAISFDSSDRSIIYVRLDIQTTTTSGNVNMQVVFFEGVKRLTTFSFLLKVQSSPLNYADITSKWLFNVLVTANLVTDKTLRISGASADSKTTGDQIFAVGQKITDVESLINAIRNNKINKPVTSPDGTAGQILRTNGDGTTAWISDNKINKPVTSPDGTAGQILRTNGDGTTAWISDNKINKPVTSPDGTAGQILRTNGDGTTAWISIGSPTDAQTASAIDAWLTSHPEATTTVEDNSITLAKIAPELKPLLSYVEVLS